MGEMLDEQALRERFRVGDHAVVGGLVGQMMRIRHGELTLRSATGEWTVPLPAQVRAVMDGDTARRFAALLCEAPAAESSLPAWINEDTDEAEAARKQLSVEEMVELMRAARWTPERLELPARRFVFSREGRLLEEIAQALGMSQRALDGAIARGDASLRAPSPPRELENHEYLGAFRVEGQHVVVADRCYVDQDKDLLRVRVPVKPGVWHAYLRPDPVYPGRTLALIAMHEAHIPDVKLRGVKLGIFGVDGGCATIVDGAALEDASFVREIKEPRRFEEGMLRDRGCASFTYDGDGAYAVMGVKVKGRVVALRANVSRDPSYDHFDSPEATRAMKEAAAKERVWKAMMAEGGEFRAYSPRETFSMGDRVRHTKFGDGQVTRLIDSGKVEVAFQEGTKVLIHGHKG